MTDQRIHVRRLNADDYPAFAALFERATGKPFRERCFRRKYSAQNGSRYMGHMAFTSDGTAVAALGLLPQWIERGATRLLAAQAVDAVTLPENRRQGLFRRLVRANEEMARQEDVDLLFGFAERDRGSAVGLRGLGWTPSAGLLRYSWLTPVTIRLKVMRKYLPEQQHRSRDQILATMVIPAEALDEVAFDRSLFARSNGWHGVRDIDFMRARLDMGSHVLRLDDGHAWISIKGRELRIGDLFGADQASVLRGVIAFAGRIGCDAVVLVGTEGHALDHLVQRVPAMVQPTNGETILLPLSAPAPLVTAPFHFTSGDSDTF